MAYAQSSSHFEIQNLRDALAASQKRADKYAHLIASLSYELDNLRSNICHSCKKKLASSNSSVPSITNSATQGSTGTATVPIWRRVFKGRQRSRPTTDNMLSMSLSNPLVAPQKNDATLPVPEAADCRGFESQMTPTPNHPTFDEDTISSEQKPKFPMWSVVYHPEVKQALELHLAHTFTYDAEVYCVKMSPDGQRLAVGGEGNTYLNELQTGSNICVFVDRYVKDPINIWSVQFSPNGQLLATGSSDCQIRIWDIARKRMRAMLKGHKFGVNSIAFSPDGRSLVSASDDRSVRKWNLRDGSSKLLPVFSGFPMFFFSVAFSPDGRHVAAGNLDGSLWIWDSRTHKLVATWQGHASDSDVYCTEFTPDGKGLMSGSEDQTVKRWDVSSLGIPQGVSTRVVNEGFPEVQSFLGHDARVRSIAFLPNTQWVVTGSNDQSVRVWDTESGICQLTLQGDMRVRSVDVSRMQNFLATAGSDGHVTLWKYKLL